MTDIADVLAALVVLWDGAKPPGWVVIDSGPPVDPPLDFLCVGYDRSGEPAVTVRCSDSKSPAMQHHESYDVSSLLDMWNGSDDPDEVRAAILGAFGTFRAAVRADRRLGGLVTDMYVAEYDLDQDVSSLGNVASIRFTVHVETFA